jgi:hypothetical protein
VARRVLVQPLVQLGAGTRRGGGLSGDGVNPARKPRTTKRPAAAASSRTNQLLRTPPMAALISAVGVTGEIVGVSA